MRWQRIRRRPTTAPAPPVAAGASRRRSRRGRRRLPRRRQPAASVSDPDGNAPAGDTPAGGPPPEAGRRSSGSRPWPPGDADAVVVAPGYTAQVIIPWGQPLLCSGPRLEEGRLQHRRRAGPADRHEPRRDALLPVAGRRRPHQRPAGAQPRACRPRLLFAGRAEADDAGEGRQGAGGPWRHRWWPVALVDGTWRAVDSPMNRRITGATPVDFSGPVPAEPSRPGGRQSAARHDQQLRQRAHAVGHLPHLRGELERLLRHRRRRST